MSNYPDGIKAFCEKHGVGRDEVWDVKGTWCVKHSAIERVAQASGIRFDEPVIIEADSENKIAVVQVTGHMEGVPSEWSFGEAAPHNYKTTERMPAYPFAMAEKRAKDRVALKLLGGHGTLYSQDELDQRAPEALEDHGPQTTGTGQRKPDEPLDPNAEMDHVQEHVALAKLVLNQKTKENLDELLATDRFQAFKEVAPFLAGQLRGEIKQKYRAIETASSRGVH